MRSSPGPSIGERSVVSSAPALSSPPQSSPLASSQAAPQFAQLPNQRAWQRRSATGVCIPPHPHLSQLQMALGASNHLGYKQRERPHFSGGWGSSRLPVVNLPCPPIAMPLRGSQWHWLNLPRSGSAHVARADQMLLQPRSFECFGVVSSTSKPSSPLRSSPPISSRVVPQTAQLSHSAGMALTASERGLHSPSSTPEPAPDGSQSLEPSGVPPARATPSLRWLGKQPASQSALALSTSHATAGSPVALAQPSRAKRLSARREGVSDSRPAPLFLSSSSPAVFFQGKGSKHATRCAGPWAVARQHMPFGWTAFIFSETEQAILPFGWAAFILSESEQAIRAMPVPESNPSLL